LPEGKLSGQWNYCRLELGNGQIHSLDSRPAC
jgi:hypothetical protein